MCLNTKPGLTAQVTSVFEKVSVGKWKLYSIWQQFSVHLDWKIKNSKKQSIMLLPILFSIMKSQFKYWSAAILLSIIVCIFIYGLVLQIKPRESRGLEPVPTWFSIHFDCRQTPLWSQFSRVHKQMTSQKFTVFLIENIWVVPWVSFGISCGCNQARLPLCQFVYRHWAPRSAQPKGARLPCLQAGHKPLLDTAEL